MKFQVDSFYNLEDMAQPKSGGMDGQTDGWSDTSRDNVTPVYLSAGIII